jgi:hypothetical protein
MLLERHDLAGAQAAFERAAARGDEQAAETLHALLGQPDVPAAGGQAQAAAPPAATPDMPAANPAEPSSERKRFKLSGLARGAGRRRGGS